VNGFPNDPYVARLVGLCHAPAVVPSMNNVELFKILQREN
jgi:hypothetical protein